MSTTDHFELPVPTPGLEPPENISEAIAKVRAALIAVDGILYAHATGIAGKAASDHVHEIAGITGLVDALAGKMPADATFTLAGLTDISGAVEAPGGYVLTKGGGAGFQFMSAAAALGTHGHLMSEVTGLTDELAGKLAKAANGTDIADAAEFRNAIMVQFRQDRIGMLEPYTGLHLPAGYVWPAGQNLSRETYAKLWERTHKEATVTISIATPGVVTWEGHGLRAGETVRFYTTGALPTGLTANTTYYVLAAGLTEDTFRLATMPAGAAINTSGSQSGTQTAMHAPHGYGDGATTFAVVDARGIVVAGRDDMGGTPANKLTAAVAGFDGKLLGASGGDQRMQQHNHGVSDPSHRHSMSGRWINNNNHIHNNTGTVSEGPQNGDIYDMNTHYAATGISIQNAGAGGSQNVQPTLVLNMILYTGVYA